MNSDDRLEKWHSFTQRIYSSLDLQETVRSTLDESLEITGMDRGFIMTVDSTGSLQFQMGRNIQGDTVAAQEFQAMAPLATKAFLDQQIHCFNEDPSNTETTGTGFCIPLFSYRLAQDAKKPVGILYADSKKPVPLGAEEKEILNVLAMHAGPAIENALLYYVATRDPLTHLYLKHFFDSIGIVEWRRTLRHTHPLSVLMIDLDDLRSYNNEFGRHRGDDLLQKTADVLRTVCRTEDIIARYGGEEFAVLLPETDPVGARRLANRIMEESVALAPATLSIGIASYPRCSVSALQELVKLSELALKQAKQAGKNRAIAYEPSLSKEHKKIFP